MESIKPAELQRNQEEKEWTEAKEQFTAIMKAAMRGQGLKLSV